MFVRERDPQTQQQTQTETQRDRETERQRDTHLQVSCKTSELVEQKLQLGRLGREIQHNARVRQRILCLAQYLPCLAAHAQGQRLALRGGGQRPLQQREAQANASKGHLACQEVVSTLHIQRVEGQHAARVAVGVDVEVRGKF